MSKIDYEFAVDYYSKESRRLSKIVSSIEETKEKYAIEIEGAEKLAQFNSKYGYEVIKIKDKIKEADIKLMNVVPKIEKLSEQVSIICEEMNIEMPI